MAFTINTGSTGNVGAITTNYTAKTDWQDTPHYAGIKRDNDSSIIGMFSDGRDVSYELESTTPGVGTDWCTIGFGSVDPTNTAKLIMYKVTENTSTSARSVLCKITHDGKNTGVFMPITLSGVSEIWTITANTSNYSSAYDHSPITINGMAFTVKKNGVITDLPNGTVPSINVTRTDGSSSSVTVSTLTRSGTGIYVISSVSNIEIDGSGYILKAKLPTNLGGAFATVNITPSWEHNFYSRLCIGKGTYFSATDFSGSNGSSIRVSGSGSVSPPGNTLSIDGTTLSLQITTRSISIANDFTAGTYSSLYCAAYANGREGSMTAAISGFTAGYASSLGSPTPSLLTIDKNRCKVVTTSNGYKKYYIDIWIKPNPSTNTVGFLLTYQTPS